MTAPSLLNPKVILTTEKWGVTLTQDADTFHARLVFEGVTPSRPFRKQPYPALLQYYPGLQLGAEC
jgi:hypothetical protein